MRPLQENASQQLSLHTETIIHKAVLNERWRLIMYPDSLFHSAHDESVSHA